MEKYQINLHDAKHVCTYNHVITILVYHAISKCCNVKKIILTLSYGLLV